MNLADAILSLHPAAKFGSEAQGGDFLVGQSLASGQPGPDVVLWWNAATLGALNNAAIAAAQTAGPPLAPLQAALSADIDAQAQAQRDLYVTAGGAQAATYLLKQTQASQALAAQAANTSANMTTAQLAAAYPYLANEIGITVDPTATPPVPAVDVYGVARAVMAVLTTWQPLNLAIEQMRLKTKAAISAATTAAAAQAAHDAVAWPVPPA